MAVRGLWGGEKHKKCEKVSFTVSGEFGKHKIGHALAVSQLDLPCQTLPMEITDRIRLQYRAQLHPYRSAKPLILIGQDNWHLIDSVESQQIYGTGLALSRTLLGWVLHGFCESSQEEARSLNVHATVCTTNCTYAEETEKSTDLDELFRQYFVLENLGVSESAEKKNQGDRASKILRDTTRKIGKAWETGLLWKTDKLPDLDTRATALKRLRSLEKRQDRDPDFAAKYHKEMNRLFEKGYAVKLDKTIKTARTRYISHFGVSNPNKPGKVRLVFDAAEKTDGLSMNDLLDTGPDLLESLPGVLMRFRQYPYAVKADIKDMFLRVKVTEEDSDAQRFVHRFARDRGPEDCKMTCLIFGSKSSPCSALYVKNTNAKQFERVKPDAARSIVKNSYMDDYLASGPDVERMKQLVRDVNLINREANFEMHEWASNDSSIVDQFQEDKKLESNKANLCNKEDRVMGVFWDRKADVLRFNVGVSKIKNEIVSGVMKPTKRELLSIAMSVFDPLGILCPFTIIAKLIMQDIWVSGIHWDTKICEEEFAKWKCWLQNLQKMAECTIPRSYIPPKADYANAQLHVFCDASKAAFAAVAYLRIVTRDESVHVALIMGKARVAPVKPLTIPRLELQAALLGARIATTIGEELDIEISERVFWSDSTTVIHWIRSGPRTKQVFAANRLGQISTSTRVAEWRWVPTELNPADDATRVSNKPMKSTDRWLVGPEFLRAPPQSWPKSKVLSDLEKEEAENLETRKEFVGTSFIYHPKTRIDEIKMKILGWNGIVSHAISLRNLLFSLNHKSQNKLLVTPNIATAGEEPMVQKIAAAEKFWFRIIQEAHYPSEFEACRKGDELPRGSKLIGLRPFIDKDGLLRARERVTRTWDREGHGPKSELNAFENTPIILNAEHYATKLLIQSYHKRYFHANNESVVNEMRQHFFIVGLRTTLRWLAKKCTICRIRRGKPQNPPMADLPRCRLSYQQWAFTDCGVDYFGPMYVKIGRRREKRWGVLFTCMTTRAVHLELAHTLSASSTMMALDRLAARRGYPRRIYSDNGTNFVKSSKELNGLISQINPDEFSDHANLHKIEWHFNPSNAPHMGGAWERLIRSVKVALDHALNGQSCTEEVLSTLLAEVEHMVNSRPLTHVSTDPNDEEALTPNHFLMGRSSGFPSFMRYETLILNPRRTFEIMQNLANGFWKRWLREYLPTLLPRKKWHKATPPLRVGDIVLIMDYQAPRNSWQKGRVVEVHQNKSDGIIRSVKLRAGKSFLVRSVHKLVKISGTEE